MPCYERPSHAAAAAADGAVYTPSCSHSPGRLRPWRQAAGPSSGTTAGLSRATRTGSAQRKQASY
eukprot:8401650-Alexandrium_andersonii.AAC.1